MSGSFTTTFEKLEHAPFGARVLISPAPTSALTPDNATSFGQALEAALYEVGGLLVVPEMAALASAPEAFVALSQAFGPEVENIRDTLTAERFFHPDLAEIMVLSNTPPCAHRPPALPTPSHRADGALITSYPQQSNWHTDQSYRRPPPDVTLLLALTTPPADQGQTLFADCAAAYDTLDVETQQVLEGLEGLHAMSWIGRRREDVLNGVAPQRVHAHQEPQRHPLVRRHPVTGRKGLYICDSGQMDFVDGPIVGMEPGPDGDGAALLDRLLRHVTSPDNVYAHHWTPGDLVIADNRALMHAATWYDADRYARLLWRTTVHGNPGASYIGDAKSWLPPADVSMMAGMENV
ncbi:MAG: TauD/TfdA family dioxygenase [Pseudomonadota bacterium]